MNYKKNINYFKSFSPEPVIVLLIMTVVCFIVSWVWAPSRFFGIGFCVLIVLLLVIRFVCKPTDEELDAAAVSQLKEMKSRALRKLGIDEAEVSEITSIVFDGYDYNKALIARGKDGKYRSSKYQAVIFLFFDNELCCFTYDFSLTDNTQLEAVGVYSYKDVVSVSVEIESTENRIIKGRSSRIARETFKLTTTGGTAVSCSVRNVDDANCYVNGMRSLIKSKKAGRTPIYV